MRCQLLDVLFAYPFFQQYFYWLLLLLLHLRLHRFILLPLLVHRFIVFILHSRISALLWFHFHIFVLIALLYYYHLLLLLHHWLARAYFVNRLIFRRRLDGRHWLICLNLLNFYLSGRVDFWEILVYHFPEDLFQIESLLVNFGGCMII